MADLNESKIQQIVQHELQGLNREVGQLRQRVEGYETHFREIRTLQQDIHRVLPDIDKLLQQMREIAATSQCMQQVRAQVEDMALRIREFERHITTSATYAECRLRERAERGLSH